MSTASSPPWPTTSHRVRPVRGSPAPSLRSLEAVPTGGFRLVRCRNEGRGGATECRQAEWVAVLLPVGDLLVTRMPRFTRKTWVAPAGTAALLGAVMLAVTSCSG